MRSKTIGLSIAVVACLIDQFHKHVMLFWVDMPNRPPIEVTDFFNFVMVWNPGVSFGLFPANSPAGMWFLIAVAAGICAVMLVWLWKKPDRLVLTGIGLVIGGAVGNVIDRLRLGAVADFFDFHVAGWHYPAFNLADSWIFIGVMLLLWDSFRTKKTADSDAG